jgi:hypothetical protein
VEGIFVKRTISALFAVLVFAAVRPVLAQGYEPGILPPHEILTIVRSTGFDPIGQPMRRGPNYVLRAIDDNDREVNLLISARSGAVLSATPIQTASRMPPSVPPGGSMGEWQRMPPGYIPPTGYRAGAPIIVDEVDEDAAPPPRVYGGRPPAAPLVAPPSPRASNPPPPRAANPPPAIGSTRPEADADAEPSGPDVIPADPEQGGMLPPPPERFPQRAAPPPPPKPVKRAAAPPKTAPLPKPKPAAANPAPSAAAAPQAAPSPPAPADAPAPDETPN